MEEHELERIQRILAEVEDCLARGQVPDLASYFFRYPDIEEELRGQFRRRGLLSDPFWDAAQFRREPPPWEAAPERPPHRRSPEHGPAPAVSPPPRSLEREVLLENLLRPAARGDRRPFFRRRSRAMLALAAAFVLGWGALVVRDRLSLRSSLHGPTRARVEGLAALLVLASEWPEAKADLLAEGAARADRSIRDEGDRWQVRWLRFLLIQGLGRGKEASRELDSVPPSIARRLLFLDGPPGREGGPAAEEVAALAALGDVLAKGPERSKELLAAPAAPELGRLFGIVRGAAFTEARREAGKALLESSDPHARLLGAVWGIAAGDPSARETLREMPPEDLATARMLVTLGEEETFLRRSRPGRIDLAPLRILALKKGGRRDEARRFAEEVLALDPDSFGLRLEAARLLREEKDFPRAAGHLRVASLLVAGSAEPMREWLHLASDCPDRPELIAPCADLFLRRLSEEVRKVLAGEGRRGDGGVDGGPPAGSAPDGEGSESLLIAAGFGLPREEAVRTGAVGALLAAAAAKAGDPALLFLAARALFAEGRWAEAAQKFEAAERTADPLDRPAIRPWAAAAKRREARAGGDRVGEIAAPASPAKAPGVPRAAEALSRERDGDWPGAAEAWSTLLREDEDFPGGRVRAAWALFLAGDPARAGAALAAGMAAGGAGEEALLARALIEAAGEDFASAEDSLGEAAMRAPEDPRPWFLRGYFLELRGEHAPADAQWDEFLRLSAIDGPQSAGCPDELEAWAVLEGEALPFEIALVHAARGDLAAARGFASLGAGPGRTLAGAFFRAAALAAASEWPGAEEEALAYRSRGFPLFRWQGRDRWVGALFR